MSEESGNKGKRLVWDEAQGKLVPGKASPWLPPEHMRELPEDYYTKNTSDPDRIHELDAPHIVEALKDERKEAEEATEKPDAESLTAKYDIWGGPFDQLHIDLIKFRIIQRTIGVAMTFWERGAEYDIKKLRHLWFPQPKLDSRQLYDGTPPLPKKRPPHLRDKDLTIDVYIWPARVVDMLREKNIAVPDIEALEFQMANRKIIEVMM